MTRIRLFIAALVFSLVALSAYGLYQKQTTSNPSVVNKGSVPDAKPELPQESPESKLLNATADLLIGKSAESTPPEAIDATEWKQFSALIDKNWHQYSTNIGSPMKDWAKTEVTTDKDTVFYPFSGPDFSTLYQLYPNQSHYIMTALQPAEKLVDLSKLSKKSASQTLEVLSSAWNSFGGDGFFVTEYLYKYISKNNVRLGATSLISTFLRLQGFSIQKIIPIEVASDGQLVEKTPEDSWKSVRFYLLKDGRQVTLDYVRMDLSDKGFEESPQNYEFFKKSAQNPVVLKAASHLPQHPLFKKVTAAILENAPSIVQDETGIGYLALNEVYDTVLYGDFKRAYKVFANYNRDLAKAYEARNDEKPLPFRVGYFKGGTYALIVAKRKSAN